MHYFYYQNDFFHFSVNPTVFVYGKLPYKVENDLQNNIALFQMVSTDILISFFFFKKNLIRAYCSILPAF